MNNKYINSFILLLLVISLVVINFNQEDELSVTEEGNETLEVVEKSTTSTSTTSTSTTSTSTTSTSTTSTSTTSTSTTSTSTTSTSTTQHQLPQLNNYFNFNNDYNKFHKSLFRICRL